MKFNGPASRVVRAATLSLLVSSFRWQPYTIVAANSPESAACHLVLWQRCFTAGGFYLRSRRTVICCVLIYKRLSEIMSNDKRTVYVGGLADEVTERLLNNAFIPFGDIADIQMPVDYESQRHRGFAFVEYENYEDAAAAIENMVSPDKLK